MTATRPDDIYLMAVAISDVLKEAKDEHAALRWFPYISEDARKSIEEGIDEWHI